MRNWPGSLRQQSVDRFIAEKPDRFLGQTSRRKIAAAIEHVSDRERVRHVFSPVASRIESSASIIIAKTFGWTSLRKRLHDVQHAPHCGIEFRRNRESILRRQQPRVQEKIQRIHVVVQRLLEVDPVRPDLPLRLLQ